MSKAKKAEVPEGPWAPTRIGQWVKVKALLPADVTERHKTGLPRVRRVGEWYIGIYTGGGRVALVDEEGDNVERVSPTGLQNVAISRDEILEWAPVLDLAELPPGRAVAEGVKLLP